MVLHARGRRADNGRKFHSVITEQSVLWNETHNMKDNLIDWSQCNELTLILDKFPIFQGAGLAAANSPRVSLVVISIKLTSVMGLTWILALITNWQQFAFLQFPSTILNSLQGIMLNDLRLRMSKTILFQLSSMAFLSDLEESDVFFSLQRWLVLRRDGRPSAGCSEKELEARVALGCTSSNSYASFVLSKLPACLLMHEPIINCGRYKNVFFYAVTLWQGFSLCCALPPQRKYVASSETNFPSDALEQNVKQPLLGSVEVLILKWCQTHPSWKKAK